MKKLDLYIDKCFKDAAESEGRLLKPSDYGYRYYIFNKKEIAIVFTCKYKHIISRVENRIKRNLDKNFHLKMVQVLEYEDGYDPNYCVCEVKTKQNGEEKHLWVSYIRDEDLKHFSDSNFQAPYCLMVELAKKKGIINQDEEFLKKISFNELKKLWMEIYNENRFKNLDIATSSNLTIIS